MNEVSTSSPPMLTTAQSMRVSPSTGRRSWPVEGGGASPGEGESRGTTQGARPTGQTRCGGGEPPVSRRRPPTQGDHPGDESAMVILDRGHGEAHLRSM